MGGLIARIAVRELELEGVEHHVSHLITSDTPHKGANLPIGMVGVFQILEDQWLRNLINLGEERIAEGAEALDSPAARQLLLRHRTGEPHPEFVALQAYLDQIGFPEETVANIAVTNGSRWGGTQDLLDSGPSDKLATVSVRPYPTPYRLVAHAYTNDTGPGAFLNGRPNQVHVSHLSLRYWWWNSPFVNHNFGITSDGINYDLGAGGALSLNLSAAQVRDQIPGLIKVISMDSWFGTTLNTRGNDGVCFVPLFSSVASSRPITQQTDLYRSLGQMTGAGEVPFDNVYAGGIDTEHGEIRAEDFTDRQWDRLIADYYPDPACEATRDAVIMARPSLYRSGYERGCPTESVVLGVHADLLEDDNYLYRWTMAGPMNWTAFGQRVTFRLPFTPGLYTARVTKSFSDSVGAQVPLVSNTITIRVYDEDDSRCRSTSGGSNNPGEPPTLGGIDRRSSEQPLDARELSDAREGLTTWPNPTTDRLFVSLAVDSVADGTVRVYDLLGALRYEHPLPAGELVQGTNELLLPLAGLPAGLYTLRYSQGQDTRASAFVITQ